MARVSELLTPHGADAERLQALDIIRGAAVLGILLVNMQLFAMPNARSMAVANAHLWTRAVDQAR